MRITIAELDTASQVVPPYSASFSLCSKGFVYRNIPLISSLLKILPWLHIAHKRKSQPLATSLRLSHHLQGRRSARTLRRWRTRGATCSPSQVLGECSRKGKRVRRKKGGIESWEEYGRKEYGEEPDRISFIIAEIQGRAILAVMAKSRSLNPEELPLTSQLSSTTFTLLSVHRLELRIMLCIWPDEETNFVLL